MPLFGTSVDESTIQECERIIESVKALVKASFMRIRELKKEQDSTQLERFAEEQYNTTNYLLENMKNMKQCRGLGRKLHWGKRMQKLEELIRLYNDVNRVRSEHGMVAAGGAGGRSDLDSDVTFVDLIFELLVAILES